MTDNELKALCVYIEALDNLVQMANNSRISKGLAYAYDDDNNPITEALNALEQELIDRNILMVK